MIEMVGFRKNEEALVSAMVARFRDDDYRLDGLERIEKAEMPGYNGRVVPRPTACGSNLRTTMLLASCNPFTVAHELAHVADIAVRRQETIDHIGAGMPMEWHLAHRMSSEYYANRIACEFVGDGDVFSAFRGDATGLAASARRGDWASFLVDYALLLGIVHAHGHMDCCPLQLLAPVGELPEAVARGLNAFMGQAAHFFEGHGTAAAA